MRYVFNHTKHVYLNSQIQTYCAEKEVFKATFCYVGLIFKALSLMRCFKTNKTIPWEAFLGYQIFQRNVIELQLPAHTVGGSPEGLILFWKDIKTDFSFTRLDRRCF